MKKNATKKQIMEAIDACEDKQAEAITILQLEQESGAFTDFFLVSSGSNPRQIQAIAEEVELRLKRTSGLYASHVEGYKQAEWVLLDYVDFVVHVFSDKARKYYDLERLWKSAKRMEPAEFTAAKARTKTVTAKHAAASKPESDSDALGKVEVKKKRVRKAS